MRRPAPVSPSCSRQPNGVTIPARLHFCWIGNHLPWGCVFAILSAVERSEMAEIILHHTDRLDEGVTLRALADRHRLRLSSIDPVAYLARVGRKLGVDDQLVALYDRLEGPVMRSDLLRAAVLYQEGGIYLDLDTLTVASLRPLLDDGLFLGAERIVWPRSVRLSRSPALLARASLLDLTRKLLRRMPHGWRVFRRLERLYFRSLNNAAMGAAAGSDFFSDYLRAMLAVPLGRETRRFALGPDLLNEVVEHGRFDNLRIYEPRSFYPLPPEISEHWFRIVRRAAACQVLSPETYVVHWYASVRTRHLVAQITPHYVRANRQRQLFSALVAWCMGDALAGL